MPAKPKSRIPNPRREGWQGWDEYAPFYDWENARTVGRADVPFWRRLTSGSRGRVLELGCGTGRISVPLARAGVSMVGIDRSAPMLGRAARRLRALGARRRGHLRLVRGDIRALPFASQHFETVLAAYGVLQSLTRERDLAATLASVSRVIVPGGLFGVDLVPDVPNWHEYKNRVQLRGRAAGGAHLTLIESVRQDRARRLTTFEQRYVSAQERPPRRGASVHADVSDDSGPRHGPTPGERRIPGRDACSATTRDAPGTRGPMCGSSLRKRCKIFRPISLIYREFAHVRPFQVGLDQAQEGRA